jgi:hypothetical protein
MSVPSASSSLASNPDEGIVEFYVGNPQVSLTSGTLRLFKSWTVCPETCQVIVFMNPEPPCLCHYAHRLLSCRYLPISLFLT